MLSTSKSLGTVVFDLDGVLLDSTDNMRIAFAACWESAGRTGPAPFDAFLTRMGAPLGQILAEVGLGDDAVATYERISADNRHLLTSFDGVPETLRRLREAGVSTAVATGKDHQRAVEAMRATGLDGLVDVVVGSDEVARPKPSREIIDAALAGLKSVGKPVSSVVCYVGDSVLDMQCGRDAELPTIAVAWGQTRVSELEAQGPVQVCMTPDDLWAALHRAAAAATARCKVGDVA